MITLFHNSSALLYCGEEGRTIGSTDVFDRVHVARERYEAVGLGGDTPSGSAVNSVRHRL